MWEHSLSKCDANAWKKCIERTEKVINEWSGRAMLLKGTGPEITIEGGNDSKRDTCGDELQ